MKAEYDLFVAYRGAVRAVKGKTPTTLYLDDAVLDVFRLQAQNQGLGCQTLINKALRGEVLTRKPNPVTVADQQQVVRKKIHAV